MAVTEVKANKANGGTRTVVLLLCSTAPELLQELANRGIYKRQIQFISDDGLNVIYYAHGSD